MNARTAVVDSMIGIESDDVLTSRAGITKFPEKAGARTAARTVAKYAGPLSLCLLFALAATLTWRKWPDLLVDFGAQLYIPWRISQGAVLYRDINYLPGGPLSQYFNALLFKAFSPTLTTLVFANLASLAAVVGCIYSAFRRASDSWTATLVSAAVLLVFAFNQICTTGNYNYVTPYSHEAWHGLALSVFAICLVPRSLGRKGWAADVGIGLCAGAVFLTKPDVFLALSGALAVAVVLTWRAQRRFPSKAVSTWCVAGMIFPAGFFAYFCAHQSAAEAVKSVCFAWVPLLNSQLSNTPFYRWCMGMDAPMHHLRRMCIDFAVLAGLVGLVAILTRRQLTNTATRVCFVAAAAIVAGLASAVDWTDAGRALPLIAVTFILIAIWQGRKLWSSPNSVVEAAGMQAHSVAIFPIIWGVFSLLLLAKLGLHARIWHYGFTLAMPAFVSGVFLLHWTLPKALRSPGAQAWQFRFLICLAVGIACLRVFVRSQHLYAFKSVEVGEGGNRMYAFNDEQGRAQMISAACVWIKEQTTAESTLAVLPEGVTINFLTQRVNPTHLLVWDPSFLRAFNQEKMTADFIRAAPDFVMFVHRDSAEFGEKYFGQEKRYGGDLMQWIDSHYETAALIGNEPLKNNAFGIKIVKRKSSTRNFAPERIKRASASVELAASTGKLK
jgi:hypothetical protein